MAKLIYPVEGKVTSGFKTKERPNHLGVDFHQNGNITVRAAAAGKVIKSGRDHKFGEYIVLQHDIEGERIETFYGHLKIGTKAADVGDEVEQGQPLAKMGSTGRSTRQHLHFEVRKGKRAVDPIEYLETGKKGKAKEPQKISGKSKK